MVYENILQTIGDTPLVKINNLNPNKNVNIYAKIEGNNPTGSIKDRIARRMIELERTSKVSRGEIRDCLIKGSKMQVWELIK